MGDNVAPQNLGGPGDARSCTYPHEVVADLRAEPSADRERKVQAVDLTTKQFWQYQTSLRSNKFRVIAGTFNGLDSSVRAIDLQPGACSVGLPSYGTFFRGAFRTPRGLSQRCSWVLASKRSGSCSSLLLTVS